MEARLPERRVATDAAGGADVCAEDGQDASSDSIATEEGGFEVVGAALVEPVPCAVAVALPGGGRGVAETGAGGGGGAGGVRSCKEELLLRLMPEPKRKARSVERGAATALQLRYLYLYERADATPDDQVDVVSAGNAPHASCG